MLETDIVVGTGMKLTCARSEFVSKLGVVARAVSTRSAVQILAGILLREEGGEQQLAATDKELPLRTAREAQVEDEGSVAVHEGLHPNHGPRARDDDVSIAH